MSFKHAIESTVLFFRMPSDVKIARRVTQLAAPQEKSVGPTEFVRAEVKPLWIIYGKGVPTTRGAIQHVFRSVRGVSVDTVFHMGSSELTWY